MTDDFVKDFLAIGGTVRKLPPKRKTKREPVKKNYDAYESVGRYIFHKEPVQEENKEPSDYDKRMDTVTATLLAQKTAFEAKQKELVEGKKTS